jgi:hypothetical protein
LLPKLVVTRPPFPNVESSFPLPDLTGERESLVGTELLMMLLACPEVKDL